MVREAYPYFAALFAQWHYDQSPNPPGPREVLQEIPSSAHVVFDIPAATKEEALQVVEQLEQFNA
jgi:hypothetical protein